MTEMMNHREKIGQQIAQLRKEKGLSLRELSERCGVTFQNINKIENGKYNTGIDILGKIADALDSSIDLMKKETKDE